MVLDRYGSALPCHPSRSAICPSRCQCCWENAPPDQVHAGLDDRQFTAAETAHYAGRMAALRQASGPGRSCGDPECWRWNRKIPCSTPRLLMPCGEGSARHPYLDLVVVGLRAPLHRPPARLGPAGRRRWLSSLGHEPLGSADVAQQGATFAGWALLVLVAAGFSPWCRCAAAA